VWLHRHDLTAARGHLGLEDQRELASLLGHAEVGQEGQVGAGQRMGVGMPDGISGPVGHGLPGAERGAPEELWNGVAVPGRDRKSGVGVQ
jgi:hypothetical protein